MVRRLVLGSALMLFVELALIRWLGANLVHLSYFSNLVLLASFLGIGLGFLRSRRRGRDLRPVRAALLLLVALPHASPSPDRHGPRRPHLLHDGPPTGCPLGVAAARLHRRRRRASLGTIAEVVGLFRELHAASTPTAGTSSASLIGTRLHPDLVPACAARGVWRSWSRSSSCGPCTAAPCRWARRASRWSSVRAGLRVACAGVSWSPYYKIHTETFNAGTPQEFTTIQVNGVPHQNVVDVEERLKDEPIYGLPYERAVDNPLEQRADRRRRHRHRRRPRPVARAPSTSTPSRSTRASSRSAREINPDQPVRRSAGHRPHRRRSRVPASRPTSKYDLILFALPDSLTLVSGASPAAAGELPVHRRSRCEAARDHLSRRRRLRDVQLLPRGLADRPARRHGRRGLRPRARASTSSPPASR